jgi:hypothetical protein
MRRMSSSPQVPSKRNSERETKMDEKELKLTAAILLAGMIAGEGTTNDDRSVLRAIQLAYKLTKAIDNRLAEGDIPSVVK